MPLALPIGYGKRIYFVYFAPAVYIRNYSERQIKIIFNTIKSTEINFQKFLRFLKSFSIVKRFQTFKNTLKVLKNQNRGTLFHTPRAFKKA